MIIQEFDRLQQLVERIITRYRQVNFQKIKLEKENTELKKKVEIFENLGDSEELKNIEELHLENERLKTS
jgi:hypothetical protein